MNLGPNGGGRSSSPASSGRSSPLSRASHRAADDELYKSDKNLRRYAAIVERALGSWENNPQEWADYIAFLSRLLKAIQTHPKDAPILPHSVGVASKLAQCLNPALPSGVHQKALDIYIYIFSVFGPAFVSTHLHEYIPGLSGVLSFASLSVKPGVYAIFEKFIIRLPAANLRSPLKSLILGLLPAIEEATSEDFEEALAILEGLEQKFGSDEDASEHGGYFWQCLFLAVVSSPTKRQGALNFLTRRLPKFVGVGEDLSPEAEAMVSPDPGLLIRCFVSGLSDQNALVQRGFLDLLVTHLPIHSTVLQKKVDTPDLDRLVSAVIHVLLRRDMSLNRRLWSWFLGPGPKDPSAESSSPNAEAVPSTNKESRVQLQYFESYGKVSLERCILALFRGRGLKSTGLARPFRICLSLMDRWEIGASLVPQIFMPAIESAYRYCKTASSAAAGEIVRSASLFFDGVEASLIFASLTDLLRTALNSEKPQPGSLQFFTWIITHFNVRDEEMITTHVPYTLLYLLGLLDIRESPPFSIDIWVSAIDAALRLLELIPSRVFDQNAKGARINGTAPLPAVSSDDVHICKAVTDFYTGRQKGSRDLLISLTSHSLSELLTNQATSIAVATLGEPSSKQFSHAVPVLLSILGKSSQTKSPSLLRLFSTIENTLSSAEKGGLNLPLPTVQAIISLLSALNLDDSAAKVRICNLEPNLTKQLWQYISPNRPKFHVEAVRSLWLLGDLTMPRDYIKVSLLDLLRQKDTTTLDLKSEPSPSTECFALLWSHSIPARTGLTRKASNVSLTDAEQLTRRLDTLFEPLLLVLESLFDSSHPEFEYTRRWLTNLPTLEQIFKMLLSRTHALFTDQGGNDPDSTVRERQARDREAELEYMLTHFANVLKYGTHWTWDCLCDSQQVSFEYDETVSGLVYLATASTKVICGVTPSSIPLVQQAMSNLDILMSGPAAADLKSLELDSRLIERLTISLESDGYDILQGRLLQLINQAVRLRLTNVTSDRVSETRSRTSISEQRSSISTARPNSAHISAPAPPSQLLRCLRLGIASKASRRHMHQWLSFLENILPTFADAIFANLIALVECFCEQVEKAFTELVGLTKSGATQSVVAPEAATTDLLDGLEMILGRAHDCLVDEMSSEPQPKPSPQTSSFLGNVASGVFKAEAHPSKTAQANSRLTVIIAFQDVIRISLRVWTWASHASEVDEFDITSAATTTYSALKVRNKARQLLEQISTVEPLESLEVVILHWYNATTQNDAAATLSLLQVMHGSRPKNVVPAILDALCSRANPSALPSHRLSSQTVDLSALDVASFLAAYLESTEDDAMDEVWPDCIAFLRDVLSNPLPYRQVLAALLSITVLLAKKIGNTNFGEQRKMRRELGDLFQRLLGATFTTLPSGFNIAPTAEEKQASPTSERLPRKDVSLVPVMTDVVANLDFLLDSPDRAATVVNNISSSLIGPLLHSKIFPRNIGLDVLGLLLEMAKKAPNAKPWKKDLTDAFNDARLLTSPLEVMEDGWFPVLLQWSLRDKERLPELLSRLLPPSSAGIMFGVGATAARLDADRKTQLNLRRICLLLLASPEDVHVAQLQDIQAKLVELFDASHSSSPSAVIKSELFMLCRALFLSTSSIQLSPIWPIINENLQEALISLTPNNASGAAFTNLALLQACKLLDQLVVVSPDDFQLHEWLYITDTTDAVYQPADFNPTALSDQISEALGTGSLEDSQTIMHPDNNSPGQRRPLLGNNITVDSEDIKAMAKDDFARAVLRPFLSQLSMLAYEGVYSMEGPDLPACRRNLLEDLLDSSTIIE